ncbi:MAG: hypothetical protein ACLQHF_17090 [Terracidiphilus sp.]
MSEFPSLQEDFEEWEGLVHLQVSEFKDFTQSAIEARSFEVVSRCFQIATAALLEGDDNLRNAVYVSYLEDLDFRSDAGKQALQLMPGELKPGRNDVLDYDEQLLGRKRRVDDR